MCKAARMTRLDEVDLTTHLSKKKAENRLKAAQLRLLRLRLVLGGQVGDHRIGPPLGIVFEGWDASGKGGAIKRLVGPLDPRHVRVAQFAAPTYDEKRHHFLWRFWPVLPGWGGMAVLDRSWYGRVLVERVEGFATTEQWSRAYDEIVEFERTLTAEGMILVKFWLHVSAHEQLRRFESRAADPLRSWKLTDEDWRNRAKRAEYEDAIEDMLVRTDHEKAPWHLVAGDDKRTARVTVVETVCRAIEAELSSIGWDLTGADLAPADGGGPDSE
jgi:polyphosphate kinase 2 (PPK2 family)